MTDSAYIDTNLVSLKLDLGRKYLIKFRSTRGIVSGPFVEMPAGSYDPDHVTASGQSVVEYSKPFRHVLPFLENTGVLNLVPSAFGFVADIAG